MKSTFELKALEFEFELLKLVYQGLWWFSISVTETNYIKKFFGKLEIIKSQYRPNKSSLGVVQ